ncbi:DUF3445 domain-containing protein [Thalassobaculum sp.]|uniref:heme-dependent oxidative N-demethylase family protein n=1 Tax=Thalassobaculum sp. TaxID=2022740 RepID=UPI0032EB6F33
MTPDAPRYTPYDKGRFQLTLGIRAIDPAEWIEFDSHYTAHLAEKRRLLAERPTEVFGATDGSLPAQTECLDMLLESLERTRPDMVELGGRTVHVVATGDRYEREAFAARPLDLAGRLVQEDLCLMAPHDGTYRLIAASLCFPSRWRLADKLGRPMVEIHQPVPGFNDKLARPVDRFFDRIEAGQVYMRLNWSVMDDPALFQPTGHGQSGINNAITAANAGDMLWLRVERQTFRRLPKSNALVFGIKTIVDPLSSLVGRPEVARGLNEAITDMPADTRRYKSMAPFADALAGWLDRAAVSPSD